MTDFLCPICLADGTRTRLHNGTCWKHGTLHRSHVEAARQRVHDRVKKAVTVFEIWRTYKDEVLTKVTNPVQIEETRRGFYAGAAAMLDLMLHVSPDDVSEDRGVEILQALHEEIKAFATDLRQT
jgi:hypothetical protein